MASKSAYVLNTFALLVYLKDVLREKQESQIVLCASKGCHLLASISGTKVPPQYMKVG